MYPKLAEMNDSLRVPAPLVVNPNCNGVVVIGANYRALGVVRSLGRHGIPVVVLKEKEEILAAFSRYAQRVLDWPTGSDNEKIAFLSELDRKLEVQGRLLIPTDDEAARLIAQNHDLLEGHFTLATPAWDILRWAYDKRLTYALCEEIGVFYPKTIWPQSRSELVSLDFTFPAILKPAYKPRMNRFTAAKAWRVDNREKLLTAYDEACEYIDSSLLMLQEMVPGGGEAQLSYAAVAEDGNPVASLMAKRWRQIPIDFGRFSTYVETTSDSELNVAARRILSALRYTGVIEIEFKRDPRDGKLKLLDINPRFWGWHTLGIPAGVDFSLSLWKLVRGEAIPKTDGTLNVGWTRFAADLPIAVKMILQGRLSVRSYIRSLRCTAEEAIFAADDPLPALVDLLHLTVKLGRRFIFSDRGRVRQ
jgi:D-aspartate ligase